jgi:hypothetical protein
MSPLTAQTARWLTTLRTPAARRAGAVLALALAPCVMAACASPGSPQPVASAPGSRPPGAAPLARAAGGSSRACAAAPSAVVGAALGLPVGAVVGTVEGLVTVCAYPGRHEVIVRFQRGENPAQFAAYRRATGAMHQLIAAVPGLGKGAYLATYTLAKPPANTLAARRGTVAVFITSPAPLGAERKLMVRLLARS